MLYRAKVNQDEGIKKAGLIGNKTPLGYEEVEEYFVDSSGFGQPGEPALTFGQFLLNVKAGFYYGIKKAGQFQVYIGEYKKVSRKAAFEAEGISRSRLISKSCRVIDYINGDKTIRLYSTDILKFQGDKIVLNSGGYNTVTTKARINQFLPAGLRVYQDNYKWYIYDYRGMDDITGAKKIEFFDGIEL